MIFEIATICLGAAGYLTWRQYAGESKKFKDCFRAGGLYNRDGVFPQLKERKPTKYGHCLRFSLPPGMCTSDFIRRQEAIEQFLGHRVEIKYATKNMIIEVYEHDLEVQEFELIDLPGLEVPIGHTYGKKLVTIDFNREPHLMIAGETGGGKSTALRGIVTHMQLTKSNALFHHIDLKEGVELQIFEKCKNTVSFSDNIESAVATFRIIHKEIKRRYRLFKELGAVDIREYNKKHNPLPYIILVIDEYAELMETKGAEFVVERMAAIGRAAGLRMIVSTQRPDVKVINGRIKSNIPIILGLKTQNDSNSRIIMDMGGLEDLRGHGHGWLKHKGELTELQTMDLEPERARDLLNGLYVEKPPPSRPKKVKAITIDDFSFLEDEVK